MKLEGEAFLLTLLRGYYGGDEPRPLQRAVLESSYFIDPAIVAQSQCLPVIRARRMKAGEKKNTVVGSEFVSDNFPADYVFRAATADSRHHRSTHLCHIYGGTGQSNDTFYYTNLANLCLVPSFLAKLTDTEPLVREMLKQASFALYGFDPLGTEAARGVDEEVRRSVRTAAPPSGTLFDSLSRKRDAKFLLARSTGSLFSATGEVDAADAWVSDMIGRRDRRVAPPVDEQEEPLDG